MIIRHIFNEGCEMSARNAMIAKIKIAQKELAIPDDAYRALLERVTGLRSCGQMDVEQLEKVLSELVAKGFVPKNSKKEGRPNSRQSADAMMRKIEALILDNGWSWNYAHGTAKRMFGVDRVQWLNDANMHKLLAALQIAANRKNKKGG